LIQISDEKNYYNSRIRRFGGFFSILLVDIVTFSLGDPFPVIPPNALDTVLTTSEFEDFS